MRHSTFIYMGLILLGLLSACGDDKRRRVIDDPPPNVREVSVTLRAEQVVGGGAIAGSASANLSINTDDDHINGTVTLTGIEASAVTLNQGFAGENGTVLITLGSDSATSWSISENKNFSQADIDNLEAGNLYLQINTTAQPEGALRGQLITGDIKLYFVDLSSSQAVPIITSSATGKGAVTVNSNTGAIVVHVNTVGLNDATIAHVHRALAGVNGPFAITLSQDPEDPAHWFSEDGVLNAELMTALDTGALYLNVHTPAHPPGEVRGQIVTDNTELVFTALTGGDVVPSVTTTALAVAATTLQTATHKASFHLNALGLDNALSATINQGIVGQNGPVVLTLTQDTSAASHWFLEDVTLTQEQYAALRNQGYYYTVSTPANPSGEVRGQLEPVPAPNPGGTFKVASINPANGATVSDFPAAITVTFNRNVLAATVGSDQVTLLASGGDGGFTEGNEVTITPTGISATGAVATIDLSGISVADDVYQVSLDGSGANAITDTASSVLDGDSDGTPGGDFHSTFTLMAAAPPVPTFSFIQTNIFTPSCALSGCHGSISPARGMSLAAGEAYNSIVGVASVEVPSLQRIKPSDAINSYLVQKIQGTATVGQRMPPGGAPPLSNELIQAVRDWTNAGAANN